MQLRKSQENSTKKSKLWDTAIEDAERKLKHLEARKKRLEAAINSFRAHRDKGIPWPATQC
jgi:hypothetical protein